MFTKNCQSKLLRVEKVAVLIFTIFIYLSIFVYLLEAITYSGFLIKRLHIEGNVILFITLFSSLLVIILSLLIRKSNKQSIFFSLVNFFNTSIFILLLASGILFNLIEANTYTNFVYSHFHVQPELLFKPILISSFSILIWRIFLKRFINDSMKKLPKFLQYLANFLTEKLKYLNFIFGIVVVFFVLFNTVVFISRFYEFDKGMNKNFFKNYFYLKIDIYTWVEGTFPITGKMVLWCDQQPAPTKIVTFDPQIIWTSYEGLSRVYLTNCYYGSFDNSSNDGSKNDGIRLVSITTCDKELLKEATPESSSDEYYKIINNKYICNSEPIFPGLYLYKGSAITVP